MQERFLRQVVGFDRIGCQLAQEIPYLRLMAPDQFPECRRILRCDSEGNEVLIVAGCCDLDYCSRSV
jgi:hypothetical protein